MKFVADIGPVIKAVSNIEHALIAIGALGLVLLAFSPGVAAPALLAAGLAWPLRRFRIFDLEPQAGSFIQLDERGLAFCKPKENYRFFRGYASISRVRSRSFWLFTFLTIDFSENERFRFWWAPDAQEIELAIKERIRHT